MEPTSYTSGERVFGPPRGTFDADWAATALRSNRPELDFATSLLAVEQAWELLRTRDLRGAELANALDTELDLASAVAAVATEPGAGGRVRAGFYLPVTPVSSLGVWASSPVAETSPVARSTA